MTSPFKSVAIIGIGLIGSSVARAVRQALPDVHLRAYDADPDVARRAEQLGLADLVVAEPGLAVSGAELVILCVPVGAMGQAAAAIAPSLRRDAVVSDVGSSKVAVALALRAALPLASIIPAHPIAGTENSGPDAGFASLFEGKWCILTPDDDSCAEDVDKLSKFWTGLGAKVDLMSAAHHDMVLAVTSHLPHLIAFAIVGTASGLERVTQSDVIKYSAGGFRDFTRLAASDPTMWRDVFLTNKDAVLEILKQFTDDLAELQMAVEREDGATLYDLFDRASTIRRGIVE